jgi:plasmid stabilization system protein ParE
MSAIDCLITGRIPIVIGAAGHHDLLPEDHMIHRDRLDCFFNDLRQRYPSTPVQVMSPLAEGADRLIADVALAHGLELIVPLPLPEAEYQKDFPDTVEEFRRLRGAASGQNVFVIPLAEGNNDQNICEHGPARDRQYAQVGAFTATHCHILIALWDGTYKQTVGGTSHVVQLKLHGLPASFLSDHKILDSVDSGPVFHIEARRRKKANHNGTMAITPGLTHWLYPQDRNEADYERIYTHIDAFNADPARRRRSDVLRSREKLITSSVSLEPAEQQVLDTYGIADAMAIHYRRVAHRTLVAILFLAAGMALAFEAYAHLLMSRFVLALYPAFFVSISGLYFWHRKIGAHGKYLDYRALAEGLRVQLFWRLAGVFQDVASNYLRKQNDELQWIREGLRAVNTVPSPRAVPHAFLIKHWVREQETYFTRNAHRQNERIEKLERYSNWLYGAGLLTSVIVIAFWDFLEHSGGFHHTLIVFMGFSPIVAALWMKYAEKTGLQAQCKQYARFATIFNRARKHFEMLESQAFEGGNRDEHMTHLIRELGKEALIENGDWVLLHRERPIEIPKG